MNVTQIRAEVHAMLDKILDAALQQRTEYYDQTDSPIGRRAHLELARSGAVPSFRSKRKILIRRADLDAWLERQRRKIVPHEVDDDAAVERVLAAVNKGGAARRKGKAA